MSNKIMGFPAQVLSPVKKFLTKQEKRIIKRKKALSKEDPFADVARVSDNAALDTDVSEQVGHARVTAMKKQLDRQLIQIRKALTRMKLGKYAICEKCHKMINTDRLVVRPETTTCISCEKKKRS